MIRKMQTFLTYYSMQNAMAASHREDSGTKEKYACLLRWCTPPSATSKPAGQGKLYDVMSADAAPLRKR